MADASTPAAKPGHFTGFQWILMLVVLALTNFMEVLDISIANVSINSISGALGVSPNEGTWVITSYTVANAVAVPLTGWLAARFGQVRMFTFAIAVFTFASWVCGMAFTLSMLISARVLQGAVAGFMIPLSQAMMINNSPPQSRTIALAVWGMTVTIAPIAGPLLGGWITDNYHWSWIFFINVPAGLLALFGTIQLFKGRETETKKNPIDRVGVVLLIVWVGALQIMLDKGNELDWFDSPIVITLAVISALCFCLFLAWEWTEAYPVVDLSLLKYRNYTVGVTALGLGYGLFFATVVLMPLVLQTQIGYTATWSGRVTAPMGVFAIIFSPIVGRLLQRFDPRIFASLGITIFAICSFWRSVIYTTGSDIYTLMGPQLLQGAGLAMFFGPLISINTGGIPAAKMAGASGLQNFMRMMMGSFATSIVVTYWDHRADLHRSQLVEQLPRAGTRINDAVNALKDTGMSANQIYGMVDRMLSAQSYLLSANDMFWLSGVILVAVAGIIWFSRPPFGGGMGGH